MNVHKWRILFKSLLCYIWSSLSWCFWFWNFSIVRSLYIAQFASFHVSGHLISMDFVLIMTTTKSMPSRDMLVHRHGPATGVMPVFIPLMPLCPSIAWVLYHLYVFLLPFRPFLTVKNLVYTTSRNFGSFIAKVLSRATSSAVDLLL